MVETNDELGICEGWLVKMKRLLQSYRYLRLVRDPMVDGMVPES